MKTIKILLGVLSLTFIAKTSTAQDRIVEDTIIVQGVCGECQKRIEEAAYGKGVKYASWNKATKELSIAYREDKVTLLEIEERIARVGHSTEHVQAKSEDYGALPQCCQYEHNHTH